MALFKKKSKAAARESEDDSSFYGGAGGTDDEETGQTKSFYAPETESSAFYDVEGDREKLRPLKKPMGNLSVKWWEFAVYLIELFLVVYTILILTGTFSF